MPPKRGHRANKKGASRNLARGHQSQALPVSSSFETSGPRSDGLTDHGLSLRDQEEILAVFAQALNEILSASDYAAQLAQVKGALYRRDFARAFDEPRHRAVYAARWSPSRALAYTEVLLRTDALSACLHHTLSVPCALRSTSGVFAGGPVKASEDTGTEAGEASTTKDERLVRPHPLRVTALGAGAGAELVAFWYASTKGRSGSQEEDCTSKTRPRLQLTIFDVAEWSEVLSRLHNGIEDRVAASYAETPARSTPHNAGLRFAFHQRDVLDEDDGLLVEAAADSDLVTCMFTLNELYCTSLARTTSLLLRLTDVMRPGAVLLVVDSPGSYSTVRLSKSSKSVQSESERQPDSGSNAAIGVTANDNKRYPMHWLLDRTLLQSARVSTDTNGVLRDRWRKTQEHASRWFRREREAQYPVELEDMRYQMHVYERI